jgi:Zn-finger nucleic acid-binding protein
MADARTLKTNLAEEEFFAREDAEKKRKLALQVRLATELAERERLRALHHMRCPKCGMELQEVAYRGVQADVCFACGGVFLDQGEIDLVAGPEERGIMAGLLGLLRQRAEAQPARKST